MLFNCSASNVPTAPNALPQPSGPVAPDRATDPAAAPAAAASFHRPSCRLLRAANRGAAVRLRKSLLASRRGLTLFELVVVLAIISAMTAVASLATDQLLGQRRFEITQGLLDDARVAVLGGSADAPDSLLDGAASNRGAGIAGFVSDVGRPPVASGADPQFQAAELWARPASLAPFGLKASSVDPEVMLSCGWRGPYLRLPTGAARLADGWGRPLVHWTLDGSGTSLQVAGDGDAIVGFGSLGSDGEVGAAGDAWSGDLQTLFLSDPSTLQPAWRRDVQIQVWERNSYGDLVAPAVESDRAASVRLVVRLFGPNPANGLVAHVQATLSGPFATAPEVPFVNVALGPRIARAYWTTTDDPPVVLARSQPTPVEVTAGGVVRWNLVLPPLPAAPETP